MRRQARKGATDLGMLGPLGAIILGYCLYGMGNLLQNVEYVELRRQVSALLLRLPDESLHYARYSRSDHGISQHLLQPRVSRVLGRKI